LEVQKIKIHIWQPQVSNLVIVDKKHLNTIINNDYPGVKRHPEFPELIANAECHLALFRELRNQKYINKKDISRFEKRYQIGRQLISSYITKGRCPALYYYIRRSLSKSKATAIIKRVHFWNNGIHNRGDVLNRIKIYYFGESYSNSPIQKWRLDQVDKYFQAFEKLADGGFYSVIAREIGIQPSQVRYWINGGRPDLLNLARQIPKTNPRFSRKWLPLTNKGRFQPSNFIQAPLFVNNWSKIQFVLKQIRSRTDSQMERWRERFGDISKGEALAYLLGILVSDATKKKASVISTQMSLRLSKAYSWSERVGEATCFYCGKLGINAKRGKNQDSCTGKETRLAWHSENSPLLTWILWSALGLQPNELTSKNPIRASWILSSPSIIRVRFLQGLNDGDGSVSVKHQYIANSSSANILFVQQLLDNFEINSKSDGLNVKILQKESIIRATELPFFLHAIGRQAQAKKLGEMIRVRVRHYRKSVPQDAIIQMRELRELGKSYGEIAQRVFERFGLSYAATRIRNLIHKG
jgi:hypothetical protein